MRNRFGYLVVVGVLTFLPSRALAQKPVNVSFGGGYTQPNAEVSDRVGGGYNFSEIGGVPGTGSNARTYQARAIPEFFVGDPGGGGLTANGTPSVADTGRFLANDFHFFHTELAGNYGSAHFQTEYMGTLVDQLGGPAVYYHGAYVQCGYFLTGDLARMDEDGYLWFVARKKDIIRRRGENISGAEIDLVVGEHPEVVEAAAIGVAAELGEDEVLLAVVRKPGSRLTEQALGDSPYTMRWSFDRAASGTRVDVAMDYSVRGSIFHRAVERWFARRALERSLLVELLRLKDEVEKP